MTKDIHAQGILILDFGSQYAQLIARRVREIGVYCELQPFDRDPKVLRDFKPKGVILSGGPETVCGEHTPRIPFVIFELGVPILGVCYGMQVLAAQLGGHVGQSDKKEFGHALLNIQSTSVLFQGFAQGLDGFSVWMSHGDAVEILPPGFRALAQTDNAPFAAMGDSERHYYGVQFHPEVTHTEQGRLLLENFVLGICGCDQLWRPENIIKDAIDKVRAEVGQEAVLLGLSGGVDSSVLAALLHQAIGDQLICVFVDNGLLRLGEAKQVREMFVKHMGIRLISVDAQEQFLSKLQGVADPEEKRKIIGQTFIEVFEEQASQLEEVQWLAQGTIYPDVIESAAAGTGKAHVIKSHHNVGGLPERMRLKLLEPLKELFKDEVRQLGLTLGLPKSLIFRHPFPGPGLGVRILGQVEKSYAQILRLADAIYLEELGKAGLYDRVSQAFAVFLPVKSVGVVGDARQYEYVVALRAVETVDFMTARWAHLPYDFLERVSTRIMNEVAGISRVTYDISSKPPATIEWE